MMFSTQVTVISRKPESQNDFLVQISDRLFTQLQMKINKNVKVAIGRSVVFANIQVIDRKANEIHIPENMLASLSLPMKTRKLQVIYQADQHLLQLGPIIGLLTDFSTDTESGEPYFRSIHQFCEELHEGIIKTGGFFYVFSHNHFPKKGYYFDSGKWTCAELPLPDVIYNRIHSRKLEQGDDFKKFREQLDTLMIPIFNDRFLSKWEVYEKIHQEGPFLFNIPETRILTKDNLAEMIQKYETVFLKPINGSLGRNIIKLIKLEENQYDFQTSFSLPTEKENQVLTLDDFYRRIKPLLQNRIYLVQQGISFVPYDSRAMDFRVLCHKNRFVKWEVTSIVARVAAEGMIVSNLAKGGTIMRPLKALSAIFGRGRASQIYSQMRMLALGAADMVASRASGITGELGIDIGIDMQGKPWLIEVNSKPSKDFEEHLGKIRPSAKAIIQFCTKLAFDSILERKFD
ncbi:YheC/YheD family endospore coat-associated protein [Neobacillus fumarioli]|uniref:YheC/YheD family endospore coat-associated protein n=1 Tax=Neobacillus fumarioli TaxID=105229 RepID=UPI000835C03F|nr:YheC/YheD family protein [Neobacillus fumarioli]